MELRSSAWGEGGEVCTAVGGGDAEPAVDEWLVTVLQNPRNRQILRKLEASLDQFVSNPALERLEVPPKSAFQRKIYHLVAVRYNLDNILIPPSSQAGGDETRALVFIKTESTAVPKSRLSDIDVSTLSKGQVNSSDKLELSMKQLSIRRREADATNSIGQNVEKRSQQTGTIRGVTEEEYARARARIFKSESEAETEEKEPVKAPAEGKPHQPLGPVDGSKGFARRMDGSRKAGQGSSAGAAAGAAGVAAPAAPAGPAGSAVGGPFVRQTVASSADPAGPASIGREPGDSKDVRAVGGQKSSGAPSPPIIPEIEPVRYESPVGNSNSRMRAKWEEDIYDPDFDRSYHRWIAPTPVISMHQQPYSAPPLMSPGMVGAANFGMNWFPRGPGIPGMGVVDDRAQPMRVSSPTYRGKGMNSGFVDSRPYPYGDAALERSMGGAALPHEMVDQRTAPGEQQFFQHPQNPYNSRLPQVSPGRGGAIPDPQLPQKRQASMPAPSPPADYNNVADFPPLGRTVSTPSTEANGRSGIPWEVARVE